MEGGRGPAIGDARNEGPIMLRALSAVRRCQNKTASAVARAVVFLLLSPLFLHRLSLPLFFYSSYRPTTVPITAILARHPARRYIVSSSLTLANRRGPRTPHWSPGLYVLDRRRCFSNDVSLSLSFSRSFVHSLARASFTTSSSRHGHSSRPTSSL